MEPTTQDERSSAMLCWLLGIFFGFIPALVLFLMKRDKSRFVGFHALQALLWHVIYLFVAFAVVMFGVISVIGGIATVAHSAPNGHAQPPVGMLMGFAAFWLSLMAIGLANMVVQIVMAVNASSGKWVKLPLIGDFALEHGPSAPPGAPRA